MLCLGVIGLLSSIEAFALTCSSRIVDSISGYCKSSELFSETARGDPLMVILWFYINSQSLSLRSRKKGLATFFLLPIINSIIKSNPIMVNIFESILHIDHDSHTLQLHIHL